MKSAVYIVAAIAAAGIVLLINTTPDRPATSEQATTPAAVSVASSEPMTEAGELTLEVPGMHCQHACFPRVQETLQSQDGVSEVALADQPEPNQLTVKQVIVRYDEGFRVDEALQQLQAAGYDATMMP